MKKVGLLIFLSLLIVGCGNSGTGGGGAKSDQNQSTSSSQLIQEKQIKANSWTAKIPEAWFFQEQDVVKVQTKVAKTDSMPEIPEQEWVLSNYEISTKLKPDDYHQVEVLLYKKSADQSLTAIVDGLLADRKVSSKKLIFTKDYQGSQAEYKNSDGSVGLITTFKKDDNLWVIKYEETKKLDDQIKNIYQRVLESFEIS